MKINIYYGGRGMIDDPTLIVLQKLEDVLKELHVTCERYQLYEMKGNITMLPQTLKEADAVVLASTVEWYGIGGYMTQFLDACWLYGDKEKISGLYMCPIVMSTTYGERDGKQTLENAWELLGGQISNGLCGYITDTVALEMNESYMKPIEKMAENLYRSVSQRLPVFPTSNQVVKQKVTMTQNNNLTPQETEQLSQYASDDRYVQRTKEDIKELASMFRNMMGEEDAESPDAQIPQSFRDHFEAFAGVKGVYRIKIDEQKLPLIIQVNQSELSCEYKEIEKADADITITSEVLQQIIAGEETFQRTFMGGQMKMKGNLQLLRNLDLIFPFAQEA